jgi:predicted PurR-regulated permease PerM
MNKTEHRIVFRIESNRSHDCMQDNREAPWRQITLFLITLGVLILCALLLQPFFSAIVVAIILAVVTQRPYDWLASKIKNPSACAAIALILITLAVIIPTYFLAQEIGKQAFTTINAFRSGAHQEKITGFIANHPALASRIEEFTSSIDINNAAGTTAAYLGGNLAARRHALPPFLPPPRPCSGSRLATLTPSAARRRNH